MKRVLFVLFAMLGLLSGCSDNDNEPVIPQDAEVTLFDKETKPVAYIHFADNDSTIYMWDGTPVAYLEVEKKVYHFNGQFLGWYADSVVYDSEGYAVAALKGVVKGEIRMNNTYAESVVKGVKEVKPVPHVQSLPPVTPQFKNSWSQTSLTDFFVSAADK